MLSRKGLKMGVDPAEKLGETLAENERADDRGGQAGDQDSAGGDVERFPRALPRLGIEAPVQRFDGAVEEFRHEDAADAQEKQAPLTHGAIHGGRDRDDQGGGEEVNKEAAVPAN